MLLREYNLCYDYDPPLPHSSQSGWRAAGWTKMATSHPRLLASLGSCQNSDRRSETYDFLTIVLRSRNLSFFLTMDVFISLDSIRTFVPSLFFDSSVNLAGLQVAGLAGRLAGWQADRQAGRQTGWAQAPGNTTAATVALGDNWDVTGRDRMRSQQCSE